MSAVPSSATDVEKTVTALNAGWYNAVTQALGITDPTFLLAQGTLGLQTSDSSGLFLMSDTAPPSASVAYFDAGGMQRRSQAYGMLLGALLPETGTSLPQVLGDQYANWIAYRNGYKWPTGPGDPTTQEQLFQQWANRMLDPRLASQAINAYEQAANCPLNNAINALHAKDAQQQFVNSAGQSYSLYPYSATVSGAQQAIANGSSTTISFDSSTMDTTLKHTTVEGSASGFYDIFSGGASGSFDQLNQKAAGSEWSISGTINKSATLATQPAGSWFDSSEVSRAYNAENDNTVWDPLANAGYWDSFFSQPSGSLSRHVSQLVLVSDYTIVVTSHASYTSEDATTINARAEFGVWPFFSASASATHKQVATVNAQGELVVTHTLAKGLIEIWGVTTQNAPQ
jgi:hypothetical protein